MAKKKAVGWRNLTYGFLFGRYLVCCAYYFLRKIIGTIPERVVLCPWHERALIEILAIAVVLLLTSLPTFEFPYVVLSLPYAHEDQSKDSKCCEAANDDKADNGKHCSALL